MIPCKFEADFDKIDPLLDLPSIVLINHHLPTAQQHQWRLLFSTQIHGESFSSFIHQITNQGPVVIIVKDTNGHIFGGFASMSWTIKSHFVGKLNNLQLSTAAASSTQPLVFSLHNSFPTEKFCVMQLQLHSDLKLIAIVLSNLDAFVQIMCSDPVLYFLYTLKTFCFSQSFLMIGIYLSMSCEQWDIK